MLIGWGIDDAEKWRNQPVTVQVVGRPFMDEELIGVTEVVDGICNGN